MNDKSIIMYVVQKMLKIIEDKTKFLGKIRTYCTGIDEGY